MHINVQDILAEDLGYNRTYAITDETPDLDGVVLAEPLRGDVQISRLDDGLLVEGHIETAVGLECHRCLGTFAQPMKLSMRRIYADEPIDDNLPIEQQTIDLSSLIEQEILVNLPIKLVCRPDCVGITDQVKG